MDTNNKF